MENTLEVIKMFKRLLQLWEETLDETERLISHIIKNRIESIKSSEDMESVYLTPDEEDIAELPRNRSLTRTMDTRQNLPADSDDNNTVGVVNSTISSVVQPISQSNGQGARTRSNQSPPTLRQSQKNVRELNQLITSLQSLRDRLCVQVTLNQRTSSEYIDTCEQVQQVLDSLSQFEFLINNN